MTVEFEGFPKIPRLNRGIVITEKVDGTNAAVRVTEDGDIYAQSRNRLITPQDDNAGFARWAYDHARELAFALGPGLHFGEWYGGGIQRGYGLAKDDKRFALFNSSRWREVDFAGMELPNVTCVPVLYDGPFDQAAIEATLDYLREYGSQVVPGFARPEGIVVYMSASRSMHKVTLERDEAPKGQQEAVA